MAGFQNIGGPAKIDAPTLAHILKNYTRFGNREARIAAYERRQARRARGVPNLTHATHQQISALARDGLIGAQPQRPIGSPEEGGIPNQGNAFGVGGSKIPGGMVPANGRGGPAGGRPMVDPNAVIPQGPQFSPQSPLAAMLAVPGRPRKRRSY